MNKHKGQSPPSSYSAMPPRPLGSGVLGQRGTQGHLTTGLSTDSDNSYSLSCGVPSLQGKALQKRNGTSSSTGPSCSGRVPGLSSPQLTRVTRHQQGERRGMVREGLPTWRLPRMAQGAGELRAGQDPEAARLQAEAQPRARAPLKGLSASEALGHASGVVLRP